MTNRRSPLESAIKLTIACGTLFFCAKAAFGGGQTGLKVTVEQPFTIAKSAQYRGWGYWCFPVLQKCPNGDLLLSFNTGEDAFLATQVGTNLYRSRDAGRTWKPAAGWEKRSVAPRARELYVKYNGKAPADGVGGGCLGGLAGFCNLSDGTCVSYFYHTMRAGGAGLFVDSMWSSADGGANWLGPVDVEFSVPGNALDEKGRGQAIWQRSVQLKNGNLVTVAHTLFLGDSKVRVIALGSSDRGRGWSYLSTVAYDPHLNTEGFTEPIVCQTAQGGLICFMRTEGGQPMYQAFSDDGGKTWTEPVKAGVDGVAPDMHLLSDGVLACSYGRPGVNIMFSLDGSGRQWTNGTTIFAGNSTCYTSFAEISPGRILLIFDSINFQDAPGVNPANCIRGVYIDIAHTQN
jgi:subtilisin family serine protease